MLGALVLSLMMSSWSLRRPQRPRRQRNGAPMMWSSCRTTIILGYVNNHSFVGLGWSWPNVINRYNCVNLNSLSWNCMSYVYSLMDDKNCTLLYVASTFYIIIYGFDLFRGRNLLGRRITSRLEVQSSSNARSYGDRAWQKESWGDGWSSCSFLWHATPLNHLGIGELGIKSVDVREQLTVKDRIIERRKKQILSKRTTFLCT